MPLRDVETEYRVQVLDRAVAVLNALAASEDCLGPSELGQRLKMSKSTVHRLLAVLERHRLVERDLGSSKYRLGLKLVELGSVALSRFDIHRLARPFVQRLAEQTGETAHLGILRQSEVISLVNAEGHHNVRTPSTVGRRTPVHCTSQGKVMLAFQNAEFVDRVLQSHRFTAYTSATLRSASQLKLHLDTVRKQGFAIDDEEFEVGLRCVGAPVRDHSGRVVAAISIAGPAFRITRERLPTLVEQVVNAAADLSICLGHYQDRVASRERHRIREEEPVELT